MTIEVIDIDREVGIIGIEIKRVATIPSMILDEIMEIVVTIATIVRTINVHTKKRSDKGVPLSILPSELILQSPPPKLILPAAVAAAGAVHAM